jgi:multisubunit Na+/H+ antiporter MnhC subunit
MNIGYVIGSVLLLLVGIWLILSAIHIVLSIIGWVLILGAAVALIKVLFSGRNRGGSTAV